MKTPVNINGNDLIAFLASPASAAMQGPAELFTITLKNGLVLRYTTWQVDIDMQDGSGYAFSARWPKFSRGNIDENIGTAVGTMDFTVLARTTDLLGSVPVLRTIARGDWDGATVLVERLYMDVNGAQIAKIVRWAGTLGDVTAVGRGKALFKAKSRMQSLQRKTPPSVIQPTCEHGVYDTGCDLDIADFTEHLVVQAGSTVSIVRVTSARATGYFDLGLGTFTSGGLSGLSFSTRQHIAGAPALLYPTRPLILAPQPGDTVDVAPGCDGLQSTCSAKFSNLINFLAEPYVPDPEAAI
jgi:uncharacterized phage protein (TIGR02218 family)